MSNELSESLRLFIAAASAAMKRLEQNQKEILDRLAELREPAQGKRTLTVIPEKHLRQVVFAPTAAATTHCDA